MMDNVKIPKKLRKTIDEELQPAESIRWIEQPIPRVFTVETILKSIWGFFMSIFGLAVILILLLSLFQVDFLSLVFLFLHWLVFFFSGVYMLLTPYRRWLEARNTAYLVTDKRAISIRVLWSIAIQSYLPNQLKNIYLKERPDGTGDVIIEVRRWVSSGPHGNQEMMKEIGFLAICKPREVENMLRQLK